MTQVLASGKTGAQRYENNNLLKPVVALDMIEFGQQTQRAYEETQGYCLSNEEGSSDSQNEDLSIIEASDVGDYDDSLAQLIQTYVANNSYLDVDAATTANSIVLVPRKIANIISPDGVNYAKATSLPFTFRDNLKFSFRATINNTGATQFSIPALAGLSGSIDATDEFGNALVGGEIIAGKFYEIHTTGTASTKKIILKQPLSGLATFRAHPSSNQTLTSTVITKAAINTEDWDIGAYYDNSTYRYTPPAGYYQVNFGAYLLGSQTYDGFAYIYKNGSLYAQSLRANTLANSAVATYVSEMIYLNGTDYIEAYVAVSLSVSGTCSLQASNNGFSAFKIR